MKNATVKVLSDEDLKFAYALRDLGVSRKVSYLIAYLANVDEASSKEIEKGTGLSSPGVSIAMHTLRDNNWVEENEVKRKI
jgi:Predicted transcriptional regulator